jgi:hypothetical protein
MAGICCRARPSRLTWLACDTDWWPDMAGLLLYSVRGWMEFWMTPAGERCEGVRV